jgi:O-antigen ligase
MNASAKPPAPAGSLLYRIQLGLFLLVLVTGSFSVAVSQITLGLTLLAGLARWAVSRHRPPRTGLELVTLLLFGWAVLMIPLSADPGQSLVFTRRFFLYGAIWLGADLVRDEARRRLALGALLTGAAGISLVSGVQIWRQTGSLFALRLDQVSNAMTSGALLMLVALLAVGVVLNRSTGRRARWVVTAALLPILLALLMTMTRSAVLGLGAGVAAMLLAGRPRWFLVFAGLAAALVAGVLLFGEQVLSPRLWSRLDPDFVVSGVNTTGRLQMWQVGWRMIQANPWFGVGDCDLQAVAPAYYGTISPPVFGHMHSNLVHLAVIWGVPGFLLAMAFLGTQLRLLLGLWRGRARTASAVPWQDAWILGAVGLWVGFFVAGFTEWYFGDAEPMLIFLAVMGVALGGQAADTAVVQSGADLG